MGPKKNQPQYEQLESFDNALYTVSVQTTGGETCVLVLYTTNYAFKKQNRSGNTSALLADRLAFHQSNQTAEDTVDLIAYNKRLLQRCTNALLTLREFSGPEIISYLMRWGDRFESHGYVSFYMDSATWALKCAFPCLTHRYVLRDPTIRSLPSCSIHSNIEVGNQPSEASISTKIRGVLSADFL